MIRTLRSRPLQNKGWLDLREKRIAAVTPKQIRALWGFAARLNASAEDLHAWIHSRTGKDSLRALTLPQASRLIEEMARKWEGKSALFPPRARMTGGQARLISALQKEIAWDDRRVFGLAKKMYRVERLSEIDSKQAAGLIEALKAVRRRAA